MLLNIRSVRTLLVLFHVGVKIGPTRTFHLLLLLLLLLSDLSKSPYETF